MAGKVPVSIAIFLVAEMTFSMTTEQQPNRGRLTTVTTLPAATKPDAVGVVQQSTSIVNTTSTPTILTQTKTTTDIPFVTLQKPGIPGSDTHLTRTSIKENKLDKIEGVKEKTTMKNTKERCSFDHCTVAFFTYCFQGGKCTTNTNTCKPECLCSKGFVGNRCQTEERKESQDILARLKTVKEENEQCSKANCKNGECVNLTPVTARCVCNEGWFGSNCATSGHILPDEIVKLILPSTNENKFPDSSKLKVAPLRSARDSLENADVHHQKKRAEKLTENSEKIGENHARKKPFHMKLIELDEDDRKEDRLEHKNDTAILDGLQDTRYNVCAEDRLVRSEDERVCEMRREMACKYGVCVQEKVDHGSWTGYVTNCTCDIGARGTFCEHKCCLDCGKNGKCDVIVDGDNVTEVCNCRHRYTGMFCEIYQPDPVSVEFRNSKWFLWVVGACVALFVLLVVAGVVGPYMMWKHRVILVMKIVHYFQPYEDDDDKEWDAFVSYKSHPTDEQFVVRVLYPKLEQELGFKLCLHFRDFVPGETISNNIINAVEGSRRTILILTPRYVESEFTRFEYQKAQTEMLKRKHRIIPIMLEDVSEVPDMDKNLKGIINSVTYLEWPGSGDSSNSKKLDKFWKRLQLSLPKKKVSEQNSKLYSMQTSVDSGICSVNSTGSNLAISSGKGKSSQSSFGSVISSVSSDNYYDGDVYDTITNIDESLSKTVKPFTDTDEFEEKGSKTPQQFTYDYATDVEALRQTKDSSRGQQESNSCKLIAKSPTAKSRDNATAANATTDNLSTHYVDMEHDRYIEFLPEDNPPSVSLTRKKFAVPQQHSATSVQLQTEGYMEIDV